MAKVILNNAFDRNVSKRRGVWVDVEEVAEQIRAEAAINSLSDTKRQTGKLARSWKIENRGFSTIVYNDAKSVRGRPYALFHEHGTGIHGPLGSPFPRPGGNNRGVTAKKTLERAGRMVASRYNSVYHD